MYMAGHFAVAGLKYYIQSSKSIKKKNIPNKTAQLVFAIGMKKKNRSEIINNK